MAYETTAMADATIKDHFLDRGKLDVTEMLTWHENWKNDRGEGSWWLATALMTVFWDLGNVDSDKTTNVMRFPHHNLDEVSKVGIWSQSRKGKLVKPEGVLSYGRAPRDKSVYILNGKNGWSGPAQVPQNVELEYPKEIWDYREEVDAAYLGKGVWAWYPHSMLENLDRIAHNRGFFPIVDLHYIDPKEVSKVVGITRSYKYKVK